MKTTLSLALGARGEAAAVPRLRVPGSRAGGLAGVAAAVAAFLAYMTQNVPVLGPQLSRADALRNWQAAVAAALVVAAVAFAVARLTPRHAEGRVPAGAGGGVPSALRWERVPTWAVALAALTSVALIAVVAVGGHPMWLAGPALMVPWAPLVVVEARWKYETHGLFAIFGVLTLFQTLHVGEHTAQVTQLLITQGDLARSHGVIGQLDFELVHFVSDTALWLCLGLLLCALRSGNRWLWVAFAAASLHEVEHLYLFWLYTTQESLYAAGGFAGIMGRGGLIGSPLYRPYLHFAYNMLVLLPMLVAVWDEARRVERLGR